MTKRIISCAIIPLFVVALNINLGISAGQSGDTPEKQPLPKITMQEALKIATDLVPGRVVEAALEDEEEILYYEIEVISSEGMEVEVQVDATSGQIIRQARAGEVAYITVEEAIQSATEFLAWHAIEVEIEEEDGEAVYEIKLVNTLGEEKEIEVNALTGKVLKTESEKEKD